MQPVDQVRTVSFSSLNVNVDLGKGDGKYGQLTWSVRNGYPRIVVFTDSSREKTEKFDYNTMVTASFDYVTIITAIDIFAALIESPNNTKRQIQCYNSKFENGQKTNDIILQSTVELGKDADGIMYIAVIAEGKRKIKFDIKPKDNSKWTKYLDGDGQPLDHSSVSKIYAKSYIEQARRLIQHQMKLDTSKEKIKEQKPYTNAPANNAAAPTNIASAASDDLSGLF